MNAQNDLTDLLTAKAIQSNRDNRMATFINIDGDNVTLDIERCGKRVFPLRLVTSGFTFHQDYTSLIQGFLKQQRVRTDVPATDEQAYDLAIRVFEILSRRFFDLTNIECYHTCREWLADA